MTFGDFVQYFSDVQICKFHEDHVYSHLRATSSHKNATFFRMSVQKEGKYYITINQSPRRHHQNDPNFQYSGVSLGVGKVENGVVKHVEGVFKADREVWTDSMLKPGDYVVHVKVHWYDKKSHDFVLSGYGPEEVKFLKVEKTQVPNFIERIYMDRGRVSHQLKSYSDLGEPSCLRAMEITEEGYGFVYYKNDSHKMLDEKIQYTNLEGLKLCKPYRGQSYQIQVPAGEERIVLLKQDPEAEYVRQGFNESCRFH